MWYYKDKEFTEEDVGEWYGIVYIITNIHSKKFYIGKKQFTFLKTKKVKGKKKKTSVKSDWEDYYGSSDELNKEIELYGKHSFKREILHLCSNKAQLGYWEAYEQFTRNVLFENTYNHHIWVRVKRSKALVSHLHEGP